MNTRVLVGIWSFVSIVALGCGGKSSGGGDSPSDPASSDPPGGTDTASLGGDTGTETDSEAAVSSDPGLTVEGEVALAEDFSDWDGGGESYMLSNGDAADYPDNGTRATVGGRDCLVVHAAAGLNGGNGYAAEVQLMLDDWTDLSGEDYHVRFDIYVPSATHGKGVNVQFGFRETENFTPIYSKWWSSSVHADAWSTIAADVRNDNGVITFSNFDDDPEDWLFNAVRIQLIINGASAAEGDELLFYIDNVVVSRNPEDTESDTTGDTEDAGVPEESGYTVTVDGALQTVVRTGRFDVPINYVRIDDTGAPMQVSVTSKEAFGEVSIHPASRNIDANVSGGELTFTVTGPAYLIVNMEGQEKLFVLIDPAEVSPPRPGDDNVTNVMALDGIDNTGATEVTAVLQAAVDAASTATRNIVYVPAGDYLTDTLYLKDDMTLYLADGAVLHNAVDPGDLLNHPEGLAQIEYCSRGLIVMKGLTNATLAGRGTLDGNGAVLQPSERKMFLVKIEDSRDCVVDGIVARDSCFWNTMIYRSENIRISNYKVINNQSDATYNETDGVDFDNSAHSTLENAFLYTGDDCMAVKSDDVPDEIPEGEFNDPGKGTYINVADLTHEKIVCDSRSAALKVGTKTFGETMSDIVFKDVDVINADRALVIDAVDTAVIDGTRFEDVRVEKVTGDLIDFNMDPAEIDWRNNRGTCTVTDTSVINLSAKSGGSCHIEGNVHDYAEKDPNFGKEYYIDGVAFKNFTAAGNPVDSLEDEDVTFVTQFARNITFE